MIEFQRCLSCFAEVNGRNPCPKCNWDKSKQQIGLHLEPGQILNNRYVVGKVLGQGGFGITYLGWDTNLNTKVAIKEYLHTTIASRRAGTKMVIPHGDCQQKFQTGLDEFLEEARILAEFHGHPNIVTAIEYFNANGTGYFVMLFVPGMTLGEMLKQHGRLGWWEAVKIFLQISDGLRQAHKKNVIHLDVNPDNIYLETTQNRERIIRALLIDFGIAYRSDRANKRSLKPIVKDGFAPPEQYSGLDKIGPWTDVYSLGATMYLALTGNEPMSSIERVASDKLCPVQESISPAPKELTDLLNSALELTPEKRVGLDKVRNVLSELLHKKPTWWELLVYQFQQQLGLILALFGSAIIAATAFFMTKTPYTDGELDAIITKSCVIANVSPSLPGWRAMIEIGSGSIKPIAVRFDGFSPTDFKELKTADIKPIEPLSLPKVVEQTCGIIKELNNKYGNLPIYIVASSGVLPATHLPDMQRWLLKATNKKIESVTAEQEMRYLNKGAWQDMPDDKRCKSALVDIGSGNIKGGYVRECDPKQQPKDLKFEAFNVDNFGTKAFTDKVSRPHNSKDLLPVWLINWLNAENENTSIDFVKASHSVANQLEKELESQIGNNPEFSSDKNGVYLVGGAVWAMSTLMCLDCPQYDERSNTHDQAKYTLIKPSDINEFYQYVANTNGKQFCSPNDYPNPYLNRNLDNNTLVTWSPEKLKKQNENISRVCSKFSFSKSTNDFLSMAEILRTLVKTMEIDEHRSLFFLQNELYTWPREFLIEKIEKGES
jgi:serine/threonine protein kinase